MSRRCKLPDGRTLPPGLSMSQSLSASHQGTRSLISDMAVDVRPLSPRTGKGAFGIPHLQSHLTTTCLAVLLPPVYAYACVVWYL